MRDEIECRLTRLRGEHIRAEAKLAELRALEQALRDSLLRMTGAIAALERAVRRVAMGDRGGGRGGTGGGRRAWSTVGWSATGPRSPGVGRRSDAVLPVCASGRVSARRGLGVLRLIG
jgi:hypothetical protein